MRLMNSSQLKVIEEGIGSTYDAGEAFVHGNRVGGLFRLVPNAAVGPQVKAELAEGGGSQEVLRGFIEQGVGGRHRAAQVHKRKEEEEEEEQV